MKKYSIQSHTLAKIQLLALSIHLQNQTLQNPQENPSGKEEKKAFKIDTTSITVIGFARAFIPIIINY